MSIITPSDPCEDFETPRKVFDPLHAEFQFDLDAAASERNALCPVYLDKAMDALTMDEWPGERVWLNPPYGKELKFWVAKAYEQAFGYHKLVVALIPGHIGEAWFHDFIYDARFEKDQHHEDASPWRMGVWVRVLRGRVTFGLPPEQIAARVAKRKAEGKKGSGIGSCRFPLLVVIFDGRR